MLQSIKEIMRKPYQVFFSILLFFTPLIFVGNTNELFEFPKMLFVFFFGLFIICYFLSDVLIRPVKLKYPSRRISFFLLLVFISTLVSSHFYTSLVGYYTRFNGGFLSYIVFFGLYFVGINKLNRDDFERVFKISLFSIIPVGLFGLSQYFGGETRVYSTFGQPNWLAQYLSMTLPSVIYILLTDDSRNFKIWFGVYVVGFYSLWATYSMSGILGFLVALLILFMKILKRKKHTDGNKARLIMIIAISLFIAISNLGLYREKINDVFVDLRKQSFLVKNVYAQFEENEGLRSKDQSFFFSASLLGSYPRDKSGGLTAENKLSDPGFIRLELWKSTLRLIFSSPKIFLMGSGPETFPYVFQPFRAEKLNYSSEWDFVFNKPHNYFLEIWSESGIFSLVAFLIIISILFKKSPDILAPLVGAFLITLIFGWSVVPTSLLFWFVLSYADSLEGKSFKLPKFKFVLLPIIIIWSLYLFSLYFLGRYYYADVNFKKSQELIGMGFEDEALYCADKSVSLNPLEPNYYRGRAKVNTVFLVSSKETSVVKESIYNDLKKAVGLNPDNLVTVRNSIPLYYFLVVDDIFLTPGSDNLDETYSSEVIHFYEKTKERYWSDVGVIVSIAKYEKKLGLIKEYEKSVERINDLRPDILDWHESFR